MSGYQGYSSTATTGGGYVSNFSDNQAGGARKVSHTLRPVTIKQILKAQASEDGKFDIDGAELGYVTFVAIVRNQSRLSTHHLYALEDGTGSIDGKHWVEESATNDKHIQDSTYVRVHGALKSSNNRTNLNILSIVPVVDHNEITYHMFEVMHTHAVITGKINKTGDVEMTGPSTSGHRQSGASEAGQIGQRILEFMRVHPMKGDDGVPRRDIHEHLRSTGVSTDAIDNHIQQLVDLGEAYSGNDEDHFLPVN